MASSMPRRGSTCQPRANALGEDVFLKFVALKGNAVKDVYSGFSFSARFRHCFSVAVSRRTLGSPNGFLSGFGGR